MKKQTVLFIGPQGSGKGTQVTNLIDYIKSEDADASVIHLQTGEGFRALKNSDTFMAQQITELIESGQLVPDFLTTAVVVNELKDKMGEDTHLMLDGFPRNVTQAEFLDELLQFYGREAMTVVYLDTPEEVVRERMMGRGRSDDTEDSINERLAQYRVQTEPLIDYYQNRANTNFVSLNGAMSINEVFTGIKDGLEI